MKPIEPGLPQEASAMGRSAPQPPAPPQPLVQLCGAGLRQGGVQALQAVDLTLHRGERLALVGPNGAGKTSLLRLLHGLVPPSEGRHEWLPGPDGRPPQAAMLFQRPFLLHCSALWNVRLGLWLRGVRGPEQRRRALLSLERVGLSAVATRPARSLSGGQQQRLALARAWALQPDVLFLDEPTASLDPSAKNEVERLVDEVARDGVAIVMSSHNLGQVKRLATRVICLGGGRVLADLPTDDFFRDRNLPPEAVQFLHGELPWP